MSSRDRMSSPTPRSSQSDSDDAVVAVSGSDDVGDLFTPEELFNSLRRIMSASEAQEFATALADGGIGVAGKAWTVNILLLVAHTVPDRTDRIRRHLGYSPERMADEIRNLDHAFNLPRADQP